MKDAEEMRRARVVESRGKGAATLKRRREAADAAARAQESISCFASYTTSYTTSAATSYTIIISIPTGIFRGFTGFFRKIYHIFPQTLQST